MAIDRRHPGSLLPKGHHNPNLVWLMEQPVNLVMIRHIVAEVEKVIVINDGSDSSVTAAQASLPSPPVTPVKADFSVESRNPIPRNAPLPIPTLEQFIVTLVEGSNVQASTLLCTLVYFSKLRNKLPRMAKGGTCFRLSLVFHCLRVLVQGCRARATASSSPRSSSPPSTSMTRAPRTSTGRSTRNQKYWMEMAAQCCLGSTVQRVRTISPASDSSSLTSIPVNLMEKQLLFLLDYDLRITEDELVSTLRVFFPGGACAIRPRPVPILITPRKLAPVLPLTPVSPFTPIRPQIALQSKFDASLEKEGHSRLPTSPGSCSPSPLRATFGTADIAKREFAISSQAIRTRADAIARLRQNPSVESLADSESSGPRLDRASYSLSRTSTASSSASSSNASLTDGSSAAESEAMLSSASSGSEQDDPEMCLPHVVQRQARVVGGPVANGIEVNDSDEDDQQFLVTDTIGKGARRRFILRGVPTSAFRTTTDRQRVPSSSSTITSPKTRGSRFYASISKESPSAPSFTRAPGTMPLRVSSKSFAPKSRVASLASQKDCTQQTTMSSAASLPSLAVRARDTLGRVWGGFRGTDSVSLSSSSKRLAQSKSTAYLGATQQRVSPTEWRLRNASASTQILIAGGAEVERLQDVTAPMEVDTLMY